MNKIKWGFSGITYIYPEEVIRLYFKIAFVVSPFAFWKMYELSLPYYELIKTYLELVR